MKCTDLWDIFKEENLTYFTGVPDSTFKYWMEFLNNKNGEGLTNIIAANECEAIAIATGYHLATQKVGVVYMQNAGLGKTVNPLTSLADSEVYSIPMILMIGWRGEPGKSDEPQHKKMGKTMLPLLEILEIPYEVISKDKEETRKMIKKAIKFTKENNSQFALIVQRGTIEEFGENTEFHSSYEMNREEAIGIILDNISPTTIIVSTTGKTSRELFELRIDRGEEPRDFYTVGSMGCSAAIAFGIASNTEKDTLILDGDGSVIMQMGSLATIGYYQPNNLYHIIFNNRSYESTGGQPTTSDSIDFKGLALANGYKSAVEINTKEQLFEVLTIMKKTECPFLILVNIKKGSRSNLGRPTTTPIDNKTSFMKFIKKI